MFIFKVLGSASIVISAALFYMEAQKYESKKLKQTEAFISLLRYIKKQIECFSTPITHIIKECDGDILSACGLDIKREPEITGANPMKELLESCDFYIDVEAVESLKKFANDFGRSYREEQLRSCDYYISELMIYRDKISAEIPKERKLRFAMCLCISASVILLLI